MASPGRLWLGSWARFLLGQRLAPYVPTPPHVVREMLRLARAGPDDVVCDLGCGDGRLLVEAAIRHGSRGFGVDLNAELLRAAEENIQRHGLADRITVSCQDALTVDLREATVVTLYLSEFGNQQLVPRLQSQLPPHSRVVSFCWKFPEKFRPVEERRIDSIPLYLYKFG
ncbi:unnamed protein product [Closterium sp. NIES-53]